ncbi:MAG TPA: septal ring lytic transglycosylase RlpA family protein [Ignavibacteria bacterium]|nr:septal ring lytic transglycosylase RlpA family protein [Ignavibacteria bacterium]
MSYSKIKAIFILALVLTNLISWKQADLFAKNRDVNPEFVQEGMASWYGPGFQGRKTANGERFNTHEMTAAHKTLPFNTLLKVTNLDNGVSTVVRINDRGPFVKGRIIDLSNAAKNEIQMGGLAQVRIEIYNPEEEETEEVAEDNVSAINLFEESFPPASKIFVEWINDSANSEEISDEQLSQLFNTSKIKIKVLTPDVADANSVIYQEIAESKANNYFDVTSKINFITGYSLEIASFSEKAKASELINKLESEKFKNIFLEEIVNNTSTNHKVLVGNYKTIQESKDDIVKLLEMDSNVKFKIVKIGS